MKINTKQLVKVWDENIRSPYSQMSCEQKSKCAGAVLTFVEMCYGSYMTSGVATDHYQFFRALVAYHNVEQYEKFNDEGDFLFSLAMGKVASFLGLARRYGYVNNIPQDSYDQQLPKLI